jgi:uncharacterized protein with ParB-like and HNH nuclease domain
MSYVETAVLKNSTIMLLYSERSEIDLNPEYQRMGGIWTTEKRRLLIDSILNDYDIPKIYFHELKKKRSSAPGFRYAVIDGRQRLETIWDFMDGKFTLASDFEYQRDSTVSLSGLSYQDIAKQYPKIRVKFDSFVLPVVAVAIEGDDLDLIEDMFSRLNEAVPLNAAEKRNAIGGRLVKAITKLSEHAFFKNKVRFGNGRFQHKESAARFLLLEESLKETGHIVDTKKVYLDSLARKYHSENRSRVEEIRRAVHNVLDVMADEFAEKDELLQAQGTLVVYYLLFKAALEMDHVDKITRRKLLNFREKLTENREAAAKDYAAASFDLLEYDRLSQQGTNDASGIKERYRIVSSSIRVPQIEL